MTRIVTYQHAYVGGTTSLCAEHAESPPDWVPSLGPVSHGEHDGTCAACSRSVKLFAVIAWVGINTSGNRSSGFSSRAAAERFAAGLAASGRADHVEIVSYESDESDDA